jgi:hypothetical protein
MMQIMTEIVNRYVVLLNEATLALSKSNYQIIELLARAEKAEEELAKMRAAVEKERKK